MRKTEMNKLIREKIMQLNDTDQMKSFLLGVIETELRNLNIVKARYTKDYLESAIINSKSETRRD